MPVRAFFRHSLVLTYALPERVLQPLLPPGLTLDKHGEFGFVAIAMVQTEKLRPSFVPEFLGQDFFLSGYRIFSRFTTRTGKNLRGLRILRSDTNRTLMACFGNLLTHYNYRKAKVQVSESDDRLEIAIETPNAEADLHVVADIGNTPAPLPDGSVFSTPQEARRFAGPLPFTFDYESETNSIVMIKGVRENWNPELVSARVSKATFFEHPPFREETPVLSSVFYVRQIPYRWERGVREQLP